MIGVNLIPMRVIYADRRRTRVRRWMLASLLLAGSVAIVSIVKTAAVGVDPGIRRALELTSERTAAANAENKQIAAMLNTRFAALRAAEAAGDHPDWSVVLTLLAQGTNSEVALRSVLLKPVDATQTSPQRAASSVAQPEREWTHALVVEGYAKSVLAAQSLGISLRDTDIFDRVLPPETHSGELNGRPIVLFKIECRFARRTPSTEHESKSRTPTEPATQERAR
jgi:hypothetical protein